MSANNATANSRPARRTARKGLTLMEVVIALAVISVLAASSATTVTRTVERSRVDLAGARLRALCNAQRLYWLDNRSYATQVADLQAAGYLNDSVAVSSRYPVSITWATAEDFSAAAARTGSGVWSGSLLIDASGVVTGSITGHGASLSPAF